MRTIEYVGKVLDWLSASGAAAAAPVTAGLAPVTAPAQIATPWSDDSLTKMVFSDVFGTDAFPGTRAEAMAIPAAARARNLIVSTISRLAMFAYAGETKLDDAKQPTWLYSTAGPTHPMMRLAWTVDDLIWHGWSLWSRTNNADGSLGAASRINYERWGFDGDGHVVVDGVVQRADQVILIPGLHEGVLAYGRATIRDTADLYRNVRARIDNPVPQLNLHQVDGDDLPDDKIDKLIGRWAQARRGENGGVSYTNKSIDLQELGGGGDAQLLIEARNAASLDMARVIGVAATRIDATSPKASLNYETTSGRNQEFVDFDLALYLTPITARLSMDDVVPRGQRVAFDLEPLTSLTPSPTGPNTQD